MNLSPSRHEQTISVMLALILIMLINGCGIRVNSRKPITPLNAGVHETGFRAVVPWKGQRIAGESILKMSSDTGTVASLDNSERRIYLTVRPSVDAHLHCYYRSPDGFISRIFPHARSSQVHFKAGDSLILSVHSKLGTPSDTDNPSSFLCLASEENVESRLPTFLAASKEVGLPEMRFDNIFEIYRQATVENLIGRSLVHYMAVQ